MFPIPGLGAGLPDTALMDLLDHLQDGVYAVDLQRRITYWNRAAERIAGYAASEIVGKRCFDNILMHLDSSGCALCVGDCPVQKTLDAGVRHQAEVYLHHKSGHRLPVSIQVFPLKDAAGRILGAVEIFKDESRITRAQEEILSLERMAYLDPLTGLPNRRYLDVQLNSRLNEFHRYGWPFGVLFMDIDRFKDVNDRYGHAHGDAVLRTVAKTLQLNVRRSDLVGRWGGEEFLALIIHSDKHELPAIADKFRILVERSTVQSGARSLGVTLSVGAAAARTGDTPQTLVQRADDLMYISKQNGRNRVSA